MGIRLRQEQQKKGGKKKRTRGGETKGMIKEPKEVMMEGMEMEMERRDGGERRRREMMRRRLLLKRNRKGKRAKRHQRKRKHRKSPKRRNGEEGRRAVMSNDCLFMECIVVFRRFFICKIIPILQCFK